MDKGILSAGSPGPGVPDYHEEVFMKGLFDKIVTGPLKDFFQQLIEFLPHLLSSLIIFILGFVAGWVLKTVLLKILGVLNVDHLSKRTGINQALEKGGIKETPAKLLSQISYWLVVVIFTIMALYTLKVPAIENLLEEFFLYLPNVFIAALVVIAGHLLGNFLGRATLIASVNAGIKFAGMLSKGVKFSIFLLALTMALEQLGIGRETVIMAFSIVFGGIVLAFSLAFGLAGREIAKEYLEKRFRGEKEEKDDIQHI